LVLGIPPSNKSSTPAIPVRTTVSSAIVRLPSSYA
jgi:hypothetical protein